MAISCCQRESLDNRPSTLPERLNTFPVLLGYVSFIIGSLLLPIALTSNKDESAIFTFIPAIAIGVGLSLRVGAGAIACYKNWDLFSVERSMIGGLCSNKEGSEDQPLLPNINTA